MTEIDQLLLSRIEDQMIEKFQKKFPLIKTKDPQYIDENELFDLVIEWIDFWISEKPQIMKVPKSVLVMKKLVCEKRIEILIDFAEKYNIAEAIKLYFIDVL